MKVSGKFLLLISTGFVLVMGAGCAKKASRTTKVTVAGEATTRGTNCVGRNAEYAGGKRATGECAQERGGGSGGKDHRRVRR